MAAPLYFSPAHLYNMQKKWYIPSQWPPKEVRQHNITHLKIILSIIYFVKISASMENKNQDDHEALHIVMFPWLATGHLIPFLHLSKIFAQKGHKISFLSTPRNLQRLPKIPSNLSPLITLVSLPFPKVDNLGEGAESSMDIPYQKAQLLKIAFDLLEPSVVNFLKKSTTRPDWIIFDYASHWVPPMARKVGVLSAYFSLFSAATMAYIGPPSILLGGGDNRLTAEDFCKLPQWIPFESNMVYYLHEVTKYTDGAVGNESGTSDTIRFAASIHGCDLVLFRTCVEFEPEWFNLVCELYQKPVVPVGVLPPMLEDEEELEENEEWVSIKGWLDKQGVDSVVYVALGTEAILSQAEINELALGLEQSQRPFFWVLRKPSWSTQEDLHRLPVGFEERVKTRGMVYEGWVPQVKILSHSSVGTFLTHCGWNSAIEGLRFGRPLIFFPVMNDQGLNDRLLNGKKLGVKIDRNATDGSFTSDSVAESISLVMDGSKGKSVRANARDMISLFGDKNRNDSYLDICLQHLVEMRKARSIL